MIFFDFESDIVICSEQTISLFIKLNNSNTAFSISGENEMQSSLKPPLLASGIPHFFVYKLIRF